MYETMRDLVIATKEKFQNATELSRGKEGCLYGHSINGIGCAIGCHFPDEMARNWDAPPNLEPSDIMAIATNNPEYVKQIRTVIDIHTIGAEKLQRLQKAHDTAGTVAHFLQKLDSFLETNDATTLYRY